MPSGARATLRCVTVELHVVCTDLACEDAFVVLVIEEPGDCEGCVGVLTPVDPL